MRFKKRPRSSRTLKSLKIAGSVLLFRVFFGFRKERVWCNIRSTDWTNYTSICQKDIEGYYYRNLDIWSIRNGDLLINREYSKVIPSVNNIFDTLGIILKEHSIFLFTDWCFQHYYSKVNAFRSPCWLISFVGKQLQSSLPVYIPRLCIRDIPRYIIYPVVEEQSTVIWRPNDLMNSCKLYVKRHVFGIVKC